MTARVDVRTRVNGKFDVAGIGTISHVIEPLVGYSLVSNTSSRGDPVFVAPSSLPQRRLRQLERDNVLADPADRIDSRNTVTVGVANRFYRNGRHVADLALSADYNWVGEGEDFSQIILIGSQAKENGVLEGPSKTCGGSGAIRAPGDNLGQ